MNVGVDALDSEALRSLSAQLGHDNSKIGHDGEAGKLWDALNELANDPTSYNAFMAKQLQHLDSNKDGEVVLKQRSALSAVPPFVPSHGFVVKVFTKQAKLFANICCHETAVPKPVDGNGNEVTESCRSFENMQIPLLISKMRNCVDGSNNEAMAVDVVVNSWCIEASKKVPSFKSELAALAVSSLKEEHSIEIEARGQVSWKIIKSKYKGGLGRDGTNPRPFEDGREMNDDVEEVTDTPSSLLKCREDQKEELRSERGLKLPQFAPHEDGAESTKLIQEISSRQPTNTDAAEAKSKPSNSKTSTSKEDQAIKPGFLNKLDSKKPLYSNDGSTGTGSSGTGGSFAKLMSKCTVIDTTTLPSASRYEGRAPLEPGFHPQEGMKPDVARTLKNLSNAFR